MRRSSGIKNKNVASPKISIITIVYNNVRDIEHTILSVINQTYSNIEYIIIDGASTNTVEASIYWFRKTTMAFTTR